jgi:hypothetical protein
LKNSQYFFPEHFLHSHFCKASFKTQRHKGSRSPGQRPRKDWLCSRMKAGSDVFSRDA